MITTSSEISTISKHDHRNGIDEHFNIYQDYAVDISAIITTDKNANAHIKMTVRSELEIRNLYVKEIKIENVKLNEDEMDHNQQLKIIFNN